MVLGTKSMFVSDSSETTENWFVAWIENFHLSPSRWSPQKYNNRDADDHEERAQISGKSKTF